jgi:glycosyltransferase involved in cell wall biosynthesis
MLSVIIPARNEMFLTKTVNDIFAKAKGDIEVIVVLEGYWPNPMPVEDKRLTIVHREPGGMRSAINLAAHIAKGKYLMKCDAHCMFDEGFDVKLADDCEENWVVIPRRYRLDPENWCWRDVGKPPIDLHYLSCPATNPDNFSMHGAIWPQRDRERLDVLIDETMSFQGSCWFMHRTHFWDFLGGMSEEGYGDFCQEPQEIGNKTWLGGGKVMVNKKTWYAHLHKGKTYGRGYPQSKDAITRGHVYAGEYWMNNKWDKRIHDIEWLVEKFWPVPTWPDDRNLWKTWQYKK